MKLTYHNTTIDFFNFPLPSKAVISLSGGLDSASLAYLTCKHFPQIELVPFCARDENAPKDAEAADDIVKWLQKEFPANKINDILIYNFNDRTESYVSWQKCDKTIRDNKRYKNLNRIQMSKIIQLDDIAENVMNKNHEAMRLDGITRNPPNKYMKRLGFIHLAERRRDQKGDIRPTVGVRGLYQPYANVDKKFVADIFKQNNLMETLFPLTRSCTGTAKDTDNFTKECNKCFWCYEKKWAFNIEG